MARRGGEPWGILARLMLAGTIGGAGITMMLDMTEAGLAAHSAAQGEPAAVQALFDLVSMVTLTMLPQAIFLVGAAAGILRSAVAPCWLGWLALLPAAGAIVGAAELGDRGGPVAIAGLVGGYIPMLLWMTAMSIALFVRREDSIPAVGEQTARARNQLWQLEA